MKKASRRKPDSKRTQGVDRHIQPRLSFHLPGELLERLEGYLDSLQPRPDRSAALRLAVEEFLQRRGG